MINNKHSESCPLDIAVEDRDLLKELTRPVRQPDYVKLNEQLKSDLQRPMDIGISMNNGKLDIQGFTDYDLPRNEELWQLVALIAKVCHKPEITITTLCG